MEDDLELNFRDSKILSLRLEMKMIYNLALETMFEDDLEHSFKDKKPKG